MKKQENGPEIQKVLVCTTAHLTEELCNHILPNSDDLIQIFNYESGIIVRIPCWICDNTLDFASELKELQERVGESLIKLMKYAKGELDCWAINFDCDGLDLEGFRTYDW